MTYRRWPSESRSSAASADAPERQVVDDQGEDHPQYELRTNGPHREDGGGLEGAHERDIAERLDVVRETGKADVLWISQDVSVEADHKRVDQRHHDDDDGGDEAKDQGRKRAAQAPARPESWLNGPFHSGQRRSHCFKSV